jgi:uncharacterized protein (DUF362 family)
MQDIENYFKNLSVAIYHGTAEYSSLPPYNPSDRYPEYEKELGISEISNPAYEGVRTVFQLLEMDKEHYGTQEWNPLADVIRPGNTIVIKPNFVLSDHYRGGNLFSIITHPSVIRAIVDYVYKALSGEGKIIIADTPQMDCDFQELLERTRLDSIQDLYWKIHKFEIEIRDLRQFWFKYENENYVASQEKRISLPGDPDGNVVINLAGKSAFDSVMNRNFYGADYNRGETIYHHTGGRQEYMLSKTILNSDVLISVPKLKVHKKVGVTLNAKGLVGTITNKNYLVHYTLGTPKRGGDQFPENMLPASAKMIIALQRFLNDALLAKKSDLGSKLYKFAYSSYRKILKPLLKETSKKIVLLDGGNWYGNDSAWRMVSDLMKISIYADKKGVLQDTPQRKIFSIIDGIIGGEGNGPLFPDEKKVGIIVSGFNHLAVDIVATRLMGFDWKKLPWISDLINNKDFDFFIRSVDEITTVSNDTNLSAVLNSSSRFFSFVPHPGWRGHIEI